MALSAKFIVSQSFPNAGGLQLPQAPVLTGSEYAPGGPNTFDVGQYDSYSFHAFLTGSNVNGTLYHRVSNNCAGFASLQSQSFNGSNLSIDWVFLVPQNASQYAQLYWSGSGAGQVTASVALYGRTIGGRNR